MKDLFPVFPPGGNIPIETMSEPDNTLIAEFSARRSEAAFAALVRQHINLVFATAVRQVGDAGAAEEITQNVFVALAQSAEKLGSHPTIAGWLHQTALNKSREWLRGELRRRKREQIAVHLDSIRAEGDSVWAQMVPLLDEALLELREPDRQAVILHYLEGQNFQMVGSALGIREDAARKRVQRCLEQLTDYFRRQGFATPALSGAPWFALSAHAAPAGLAATVTHAGLAAGSTASTLTLLKGALKLMVCSKTKIAIVTGVALFLTAATATVTTKLIHTARTKAALAALQGSWEGTLTAGPTQLRLVLRIFETNGNYRAVLDSVDQGVKDIPVAQFLAQKDSFQAELPALQAHYHAELQAGKTEMSGTWQQLGHSIPLTLKRTATPAKVEEAIPADEYVRKDGSDLQGEWEGTLQVKDATLRLGLKIAEPVPGTFHAQMDSIDQGVKNLPINSLTYHKPAIHFEMNAINGTFEGDLNVQTNKLTGTWTQLGGKYPLIFQRVNPGPAAAQDEKDFGSGNPYQPQGHWRGTLEVKGVKIALVFHIARLPDDSYSATMDSPDQGVKDIPTSQTQIEYPNVRLEWQAFGGSFTAKLAGGKLSGIWRQGKVTLPLQCERSKE